MPRPVRRQRQLNRLQPGGETVHGHEETARSNKGEHGEVGGHEAVDAADEGTHEETQRGRRNGRQHHERQAGQHLGRTQGQCLNEQGTPEKNGALEDEGLSD